MNIKNNYIKRLNNHKLANKLNKIISNINDIKKLQLNIGDTVSATEQFFLSLQRQGIPILYYIITVIFYNRMKKIQIRESYIDI